MERWELKAGVIAILGSANRSLTLQDLARGLASDEQSVEEVLQEYEADLMAADQGMQVRHRAGHIRLEAKAQWAGAIKLADPEWSPRPISDQAIETLAIVALKQPVTIGDINAIRGVESAGTLQTLRTRKLIARTAQRGPRREKYWRTTPLFLETFKLDSLDDIYKDGALQKLFPSVYSSVIDEDDGQAEIQEPPSPAPTAS